MQQGMKVPTAEHSGCWVMGMKKTGPFRLLEITQLQKSRRELAKPVVDLFALAVESASSQCMSREKLVVAH
jgi:hypothetical protein